MTDAVEVAVPIPKDETFYYNAPMHLKEGVEIGKRALVPFKNRKALGFIVGFGKPPKGITLKNILDIVDDEPLFNEKRLEFLKWISMYYIAPLGKVLKAAHPGGLGTRLKRTLKITESGKEVLSGKRLTEHEMLILNTISLSDEITTTKLFNLVENTSYELLNSLRRRSLVDFRYKVKSDPKIKREKVISAAEDVDLEKPSIKRKPAKTEILKFLIKHGRVPYPDLKEIFGYASRHLRWLEKKEHIRVEYEEVLRDPFSDMTKTEELPPKLTIDQEVALKNIKEALGGEKFSPFLLHGVTGSGKTEVYLRAIKEVIRKGKEAIVLVPEISLTPQLVKRFRGRFGKEVAVIHSALSDGERFDAWRMASRGEVSVIIGARSAIFAPFSNLGIVVVDEEHENTYKQEETPCYNARDLALVLGQMTDSTVILGSATPSVESYANALKEKFIYLSLPLRVEEKPMPEVEVVDMREDEDYLFSQKLKDALKENFERNKQTILFLNRRGFSTTVLCEACGDLLDCPNCSISLTYHRKEDSVRCHYCGLSEKLPERCRHCGASIRGRGMGTQKIEEELKRILPEAKVERMDSDTTRGKRSMVKLYGRLERREVDVLIGTQMVAKGHDLPGVTLVGVISADISLGIPDFRSGERTFQLVTQVAGRAGRGEETGKVIVQTYNPEHSSIKFAVRQDSKGFLEEEINIREELGYPPFTRLVNFRFTGRNEPRTKNTAERAGETARKLVSKLPIGKIKIMGPSPCPLHKIRNRYRWQMLVKSEELNLLHKFSKHLLKSVSKRSGRVRVSVDVDPLNFS